MKKHEKKMVKLYIFSFNNDVSWIKKGIPIEVGANLRDTFMYELRDNTGNNISSENQYFGELTGLYWVWKNEHFEDTDIIGFCHYNKYLDISDASLESLFRERGRKLWVCAEPVRAGVHTYPEDIAVLEKVLEKDFPTYYKAWQTLYTSDGDSIGDGRHLMQLFYTSKNEFEQYCEFLFGVMFKVRDIIGDVERVPYHKRYCAFLGERLTDVYLKANEREVIQVRVKRHTNIVRRAIHACAFLGRNTLIRNVYMKFRTSNFYNNHLDEKKSSWRS